MIDTIVCVLKRSQEYDVDYVERLTKSIRENCTKSIDIVCLSDTELVSKYCDYVPLENSSSGWWNKLELFSNKSLKGRSILYFDLDTVIRGDITKVLEYDHTFTMLDDFLFPHRFASGVLAFSGDHSYLKDHMHKITNNYRNEKGNIGDQAYIEDHVVGKVESFQKLFPNTFCSYKVHKETRSQYPIVCFHGKPRPRTVNWQI